MKRQGFPSTGSVKFQCDESITLWQQVGRRYPKKLETTFMSQGVRNQKHKSRTYTSNYIQSVFEHSPSSPPLPLPSRFLRDTWIYIFVHPGVGGGGGSSKNETDEYMDLANESQVYKSILQRACSKRFRFLESNFVVVFFACICIK